MLMMGDRGHPCIIPRDGFCGVEKQFCVWYDLCRFRQKSRKASARLGGMLLSIILWCRGCHGSVSKNFEKSRMQRDMAWWGERLDMRMLRSMVASFPFPPGRNPMASGGRRPWFSK